MPRSGNWDAHVLTLLLPREWSNSRSIQSRLRLRYYPTSRLGKDDHLAVCHDLGLTHFRGSEPAWFMSPIPYGQETKARRALRLLDSYLNIGGQHVPPAQRHPSGLSNVASSRFLRPYHPRLAALDGLRLRRVTQGMRNAAQTDGTFHLWWHPHNFGTNVEANIAFLTTVLACYERLAGEFGMNSKTMSGLSAFNEQPPDVVRSSGGAS